MPVTATVQKARRLLSDSPALPPLLTLVLILVIGTLFVPHFGTMQNLSGIFGVASISAVVVAGVTMLMICGEFDLSVGSMVAMGGFVFGRHVLEGGSPIVGLGMAIVATSMMGFLNGLLTVGTGIPSFIVTLGTRSIYRGVVWIYSGGVLLQGTKAFPMHDLFNGRLDFINQHFFRASFGVPILWAIAVGVILQFLLTRTTFGNRVFATGGNREAALAQGVKVKRVKVLCFTLNGLLCGVAGALMYGQFLSIFVATGRGLELTAIASAVVGGTVLTGGTGSILGGLLGLVLINTLRSGAVLAGLPSDNFEAIVGVAIIASAFVSQRMRDRA